MPLSLADDALEELRSTARDALIEIACRLYNADRIAKPDATRITGLSRVEFEHELTKRGLPWIRVDLDEPMARELAAYKSRR